MEAKPEKFNLADVAREVIGFYKVTAFEKQVSLVNGVDGEIMVVADKNMIRTVLRNLLSNALKYTNMGGQVELGSRFMTGSVEIFVKDNGLGMTPEMVTKLFRLDTTFSTVGTANEHGTGLGLILCNEFILKNRGSIYVQSEYGFGSTFRFTLPLSD
jgi:signal transduction histidine kinase